MLIKDYASLEAVIDKGESSRLLIEIALRPASLAGPVPAYDPGEVQRAIRDGFREVLAQVEFERLDRTTKPPKSRARRWFGRGFAFMLCAALGSVNDPSSVGFPYRASICRRIDGATACRAGVAVDRSPEPGFAIDRRARDIERRAGRAADGSGDVRAA